MPDQAHDLRQLAIGRGQAASAVRGNRPIRLAIVRGDCGGGDEPRLFRQADAIVIVTTSEEESVLCTFAKIRAIVGSSQRPSLCPLYLWVNQARSRRESEIVHYRIARTCKRILGIELRSVGYCATAVEEMGLISTVDTIGLNSQLSLADTRQTVLIAESLSNCERRDNFSDVLLRHRLPAEMDC
jgi:hypothetical protein